MRHEIFRAGTRTDNSGRTITITPEQVAAIASHYSPDKHEAPIVVGHPSTNAPAYGWVGSLKAENGTLFADFAQVDDDFAELVKRNATKKFPPASIRPTTRATRSLKTGIYATSAFWALIRLRLKDWRRLTLPTMKTAWFLSARAAGRWRECCATCASG